MSRSYWDYYGIVESQHSSREARMQSRNLVARLDMAAAASAKGMRDFDKADEYLAMWIGDTDSVYRVYISPTKQTVEVVFLGIDSVDSEGEGIYDNTSLLPEWMQEKLAVLQMMKVDPPQTKVEGVGMRVDRDVFWIIKG